MMHFFGESQTLLGIFQCLFEFTELHIHMCKIGKQSREWSFFIQFSEDADGLQDESKTLFIIPKITMRDPKITKYGANQFFVIAFLGNGQCSFLIFQC